MGMRNCLFGKGRSETQTISWVVAHCDATYGKTAAMKQPPDVQTLLNRASGQVSPQRLRQLVQKLELALGRPLSSHTVNDPVVLRRSLVEQLRREGASAGSIQSLTQCLMGIIRRAAVDGLLPAPPEGPWTRTWQSVLDFAGQNNGVKAYIRSLGAWATKHHLDPDEIKPSDLQEWLRDLVMDANAVPVIQGLLREWAKQPLVAALESDSIRATRLRRKAMNGTVDVTSRAELRICSR